MKKYLFIAAAAIAVLSGCQKEGSPVEEGQQDSRNGLVFTASIEQGENTKTTLETTAGVNYGKIYWESGDQISINGTPYSATPDGGDATKATFTKVSGEDPTGTFCAYYPASVYNGGTPTLPPTQSYAAGKISNNPMYATSEDTNLSFKNICGLLAVKVTNADIATLKSIRVSSSNHDVSGAFTVDASNNAVLSSDAGGTNKVELVCDEELDAEGTVFYIAIPPATYRDLLIELSSNGTYFNKSMVTKPATDIVVARNKVYNIDFADNNNCLCFTATGGITVALNIKGSPTTNTVEYSKDKSSWTEYTHGTGIALTDGQKLYFRAKTNREAAQDADLHYVYFSITGDGTAEVSGNVMYLLNTDPGLSMYYQTDCFGLFKNCKKLTKADRLLLPATSLTESCYQDMFKDCESLTTTPFLPAESLAWCCYQYMFSGCGSLTTAPALPAESLAEFCYANMFSNCGSLTTAPTLPATTLVEGCYKEMFFGCGNLRSITCLATDISASECTEWWVKYVSGSGTFTKASGMTGWSTGDKGIPSGWEVTDYTP